MAINLASLASLTPEDRRDFVAFGIGGNEKPRFNTLHQAIEHQASHQPFAIAAMHGKQSITYKELNDKAEQLAEILMINNIKPGDVVGLFLTRSIPMLIGMLAVLKMGCSYVPQHVGVAPDEQLKHIVDTARIRTVLTLSTCTPNLPCFENCRVMAIDTLLHNQAEKAGNHSNASVGKKRLYDSAATCFILFTSGTTGRPNGVQISHKNVCNIVLTSPGNLGIKPGMRVAQILSIAFDMSAWEIYGCLCHGATLMIRDGNIELAACNADVVIATPSILSQLDTEHCQDIKVAAVAGEPCPKPLADKWASFCTFYNSCGPTETTIINTAQQYKPGYPLTIGTPTPNNTVYILDENLKPCPIGEIGEMWAGGHCVSKGYLANADLSQKRYKPDPFLGDGHVMFRTRDLGRWTETGELEHLGRTDDQVKIKGFRVELDSVSSWLESIDGCSHAVTLKLDDEHLVSFVTPAFVNEESAKMAISKQLPYYCVPLRVFAMDKLPVTSRGKIDKRLLLTLASNNIPPQAIPPLTKVGSRA